jgi:predicted GNAT family N-acyltransferase
MDLSAEADTRVLVTTNAAERASAFELRCTVFVKEQGVPFEEELDGKDNDSEHFLLLATAQRQTSTSAAEHSGQLTEVPVACARLRRIDSEGVQRCYKLERVAVLAPHRGRGLGRKLVAAVLQTCDTPCLILIHAQVSAAGFWSQLGFSPMGETFLEAGIIHQAMELRR